MKGFYKIITLLLILLSMAAIGCTDVAGDVEYQEYQPTEQNIQYNDAEYTELTSSEPTVQYDDAEFGKWFIKNLKLLQSGTNGIGDTIRMANSDSDLLTNHGDVLELQAAYLKEDSGKALTEFDDFSVSPEMQPFADEFKLFLESIHDEATYLESAAQNNNAEDLELALGAMRKGNVHGERCLVLMETMKL